MKKALSACLFILLLCAYILTLPAVCSAEITKEVVVYDYDISADKDNNQASNKPRLNKTSVKMSTTDTEKLKVLNTNKKVTWSSANKKVARVNSKGKVTPVWFGTTIISARFGNKTLKCKVKVLAEDVWYSEDSNFSVSIMQLSAKKARVRISVSDDDQVIKSDDLIGKYTDESILLVLHQGKYNISAGITIVEQNNETYCVIAVSDAKKDIFITDGTILDIKIENS